VIAQDVRTSPAANFAVSREGTLVYMTRQTAERHVVIVDRDGHQDAVVPLTGDVSDPRFSPDGTRLAFTKRTDGHADVWTFHLAHHLLSRLTSTGENLYPLWAPTGDRIAFSSSRGGTIDLQWIGLAEGSEPRTLLGGPGDKVPESWSPDGRELVFRTTSPGTGRDIWRLPLAKNAVPIAVQVTPADERSSALSPNGRLLAYVSDESGRDEVYVRSFPSGASRWQVSPSGGSEPAWSRDGRGLFYRTGRRVYGARVTTGPFAVTSRNLLFEGPFMANPFRTNYDVHPDGRRFVFIASGQARVEVVVLLIGMRR
jgi:Tol biopolymer transport system component